MRLRAVAAVAAFVGLICCVGCAPREAADRRDARVKRPAIADHEDLGIRVESARYGRDDTWVDVTSQVRGLVSGDTLVFPRNLVTTLNVDPIPGRMKYVDMVIVIDGRVVEMTVGDSLHVTPLRLRAGGGAGGGGGSGGGDRTPVTTRPQ